MFNGNLTITDGLIVALVAMSIVFIILLLIMVCLSFFKYLGKFEGKTHQPVVSKVEARGVKEEHKLNLADEDMVVASLIATIEASEEYGYELKVVSIKQI